MHEKWGEVTGESLELKVVRETTSEGEREGREGEKGERREGRREGRKRH